MEYPSVEVRGVTVAQFPNPPLAAALAAVGVGAVTGGSVEAGASAVFHVALGIWAWEEATAGVNRFRRVLGVGGLIFVTASLARELGAF
ncbi:MAG: hypothetical protein ACR2K6_10640 [Solirubrobacterales bacterium]